MKPEQFIREYGVEKAREVVRGASENHNKFDIDLDKTVEAYKVRPKLVDLHYLKRLVESLDLVAKVGGIKKAKEMLELFEDRKGRSDNYMPLFRAVQDHESIYGGGDE